MRLLGSRAFNPSPDQCNYGSLLYASVCVKEREREREREWGRKRERGGESEGGGGVRENDRKIERERE